MRREIRSLIAAQGTFFTDRTGDGDDLFALGMTSLQSVDLMLALEAAFDVEFPDGLMVRSTFRSVEAIVSAINGLGVHSV